MKKGKIALVSFALLAIVGTALAFKAKPFAVVDLYGYNTTDGYYITDKFVITPNAQPRVAAPYTLYRTTTNGFVLSYAAGALVYTTTNP